MSALFSAFSARRDIDMPIRIRFEHTRYPHWGERSGYVQFVRQLDPQRYRADLHAASDSDADLARWLVPFQPWLQRLVRRGRMPWYKLSDLRAEIEALKACLAGQVDIVHFLDGEHSGRFLPRLIRAARLSTVRTIATFHQPPEVARKVVAGGLLRWLDGIVLVSPSQLPFFRQYVPDHMLHVILHGVDADFFRPAPTPNVTDRIRCVTAGHWLRDWDVFRSVARAISEIAFDVVASRNIDFEGLPNVVVHSGIADDTLAEVYRSADILFLPLIESTANNTLLEGIASGLPVVATDLEAIRAYLPSGEGIFVVENRVDGFVDALRLLQKDVELRHRMGRRARARAEELAWPRMVRQYEMLYASAGVARLL
jgi:glycosyltransferase involved in cell wall biosynthesis